eukprot:scaffold7897_cov248-Pinguiococcus_pyrenoidosus.AAC.4
MRLPPAALEKPDRLRAARAMKKSICCALFHKVSTTASSSSSSSDDGIDDDGIDPRSPYPSFLNGGATHLRRRCCRLYYLSALRSSRATSLPQLPLRLVAAAPKLATLEE